MHRTQRSATEFLDLVKGQQIVELIITDQGNLVDFVGGTKAIKEMEKGHTRLQRGHLANDSHIMSFLNTKGAEHGEAATSNHHRVRVVSIDGEGFASEGTRGDMDHSGEQFSGDLVKVWNVEQETLGTRKSSGQRPGDEGSMPSTGFDRTTVYSRLGL